MNARPQPRRKEMSFEQMRDMARDWMRAQFLRLKERGKTNAPDAEQFYGFRAEDVATIHLHKHGSGRGVWYHLEDGRVIDALGKPSEPERHWYETSAH